MLLLTTGAEANEAAIKMAKLATGKFRDRLLRPFLARHDVRRGRGDVQRWSARLRSGQVPGNLSLPAPHGYRSPFRNPDGSYDWQAELDYGFDAIDRQSSLALAAIIIEPILSSGGILEVPEGYLGALDREMLRTRNAGDPRRGANRSRPHWPDVRVSARRRGSGHHHAVQTLGAGLPVAAVVTSAEIEHTCHERGFLFYTTHVSDPAPRRGRIDGARRSRARRSGGLRAIKLGPSNSGQGLEDLQDKHQAIGDIRGRGLLQGIELVADRGWSKTPADAAGQQVTRGPAWSWVCT